MFKNEKCRYYYTPYRRVVLRHYAIAIIDIIKRKSEQLFFFSQRRPSVRLSCHAYHVFPYIILQELFICFTTMPPRCYLRITTHHHHQDAWWHAATYMKVLFPAGAPLLASAPFVVYTAASFHMPHIITRHAICHAADNISYTHMSDEWTRQDIIYYIITPLPGQ